MRAKPSQKVVLDVLSGQLIEQNVHLVVESGVVGRCSDDESTVAEHVAYDVGVVSLRYVVDHDILHSGF